MLPFFRDTLYQFGEKPSKNAHIYMWEGFGGFFGFFSELVSPIEL